MTRQEFIDDVNTWGDLFSFCSDEGCELLEDVYDEDGFVDAVQYDVDESDYGWMDLKDYLNDLPEYCGGTMYRRNGFFEYDMLDDDYDFEAYKEDVLRWADDYGRFDEEDGDDEYDNYSPDAYHYTAPVEEEDEDDMVFAPQEIGATICDMAHSKVQKIYDSEKQKKIAEEEAMLRAKYEAEQELKREADAMAEAFAAFMVIG